MYRVLASMGDKYEIPYPPRLVWQEQAGGKTHLEKTDIIMVVGVTMNFKNDFKSQCEKFMKGQKSLIS
jgi:hypothetical protein